MCDNSINKEIATLLNLPSSPIEAMSPLLLDNMTEDHAWPELRALRKRKQRSDTLSLKKTGNFRRLENVVWREWFVRCQSPPSPTPSENECPRKIIVNGIDIPTEYEIYEPRRHEMAVIGSYVDPRISTGFCYKVRINGTEKYQFKGKPLRLQSVGKGYGKRLTFAGKSLNQNSNFFWSDTHDQGYAFSIHAVFENDEFGIYDSNHRHIGSAVVESVSDVQKEIAHVTKKDYNEKTVAVTMRCNVQIRSGPHGLVSLISPETLNLDGLAVVVKANKSDKAVTKCVEDIEIPGIGRCTLRSDD
ncbi:uncharacterized protein [Ptychodera flava]|uniref:uncharacterized protein n=1 Tax=Ptychodera flava TaxID=63121 RepID=UPI00396A7DB3